MKKTTILLIALAGLANAQAQGTIQLFANLSGANEVPPNNTPLFSTGTFTLNGTTLSYLVGGPLSFQNGGQPTDVTINGPANAGSLAPILFDLGVPSIFPIQPPPGAGFSLQGIINNLTTGQVNDLTAGLWYVNITTVNFPAGEVRGQIVPVPEPSALALLGVGAGLFALRFRKRRG